SANAAPPPQAPAETAGTATTRPRSNLLHPSPKTLTLRLRPSSETLAEPPDGFAHPTRRQAPRSSELLAPLLPVSTSSASWVGARQSSAGEGVDELRVRTLANRLGRDAVSDERAGDRLGWHRRTIA